MPEQSNPAPKVGRFKKAKPKPGRRKSWERRALSRVTITRPEVQGSTYRPLRIAHDTNARPTYKQGEIQ